MEDSSDGNVDPTSMPEPAEEFVQHIYPRARTAFMYDRAGPWPQPAPDHPMSMAAEVLHPPQVEQDDWKKHAGRNYMWTMLTSIPGAAWNSLTHGRVNDMSDEVFAELLTTTIYSKYMRLADPAELDPCFTEVLGEVSGAAEYYTIDFTPVQDIKTYEGVWVSPTITLVARDEEGGKCKALAIRIGHLEGTGSDRHWENIAVTPEDTDAWTLAKYFVMQGAGHVTTLSGHPATHFPYDTVNAVTKSAVPMDHTLFKLLFPHLRLALAVDHAVLEGGSSVVSETRGEIYAPYSGPGSSVRVLVAAGFVGYPHQLATYDPSPTPSAAHPKWEYPLSPRAIDIPSDFGRVLRAYYFTVKDFVREVVEEILAQKDTKKGKEELFFIRRWARYIAHWLPGFPDGDRILELDENGDPWLVAAVTGYIWDVSVAHSLDHKNFYSLRPRRTPFRVRLPPPSSRKIDKVKLRSICNGWDLFKSTLAFDMFFQPHNVVVLQDAEYGFEGPKLKEAVANFQKALVATEEKLKADGVNVKNYIELSEIATSIQY